MTAHLRRGACPSLAAPMPTGDGLLARLQPVDRRLDGAQLAGLAAAAENFGNGILEITARGNLQIRGLSEKSARALAAEIEALGIEVTTGLAVETSPLAGLDPAEVIDPRELASEIGRQAEMRNLTGRLAPKVAVTIDGGGAIGLGSLSADIKLRAVADDGGALWELQVAGGQGKTRLLGRLRMNGAAEAALTILAMLTRRGNAARARDLGDHELAELTGHFPVWAPLEEAIRPVGRFALADGAYARGFSFAYGRIEAPNLAAFAEAIGPERQIRLAPGRGVLVLNVSDVEDAGLLSMAEKLGLVARPDDPRLFIAACAGAPACASAHLATRTVAERIVAAKPGLLDGSFTLHLSGCAKQCARPAGPTVSVVASGDGCSIMSSRVMPGHFEEDLKEILSEARGR